MIIREEYFGGLWQTSYCFPSIVDGELYYSKRSRLVLENLLANEGGNWRMVYYNPAATMENDALPAWRKWEVVGTTVSFLGVKDVAKYFLSIEVHMTDPGAAQAYKFAVDNYLFMLTAMWLFTGFPGGAPGFIWANGLIAEAQMAIAKYGTMGLFDTYFFKWAPGDGDYSLLQVPIYRILGHD